MQPRATERLTALPLTRLEQGVDLNYLYHRHQVSLFMAENAGSEPARRIHRQLAAAYAERISDAKSPATRAAAA
jgi:hypothetical protein